MLSGKLLGYQLFRGGLFNCHLFGLGTLDLRLLDGKLLGRQLFSGGLLCGNLLSLGLLARCLFSRKLFGSQLRSSCLLGCSLLGCSLLGCSLLGSSLLGGGFGLECIQCRHQFSCKHIVVHIVRMIRCRRLLAWKRLDRSFINMRRRGIGQAGFRRGCDGAFIVAGMLRRVRNAGRFRILDVWLVHDVRNLRLRVVIAHVDDLRSKRIYIGQLR